MMFDLMLILRAAQRSSSRIGIVYSPRRVDASTAPPPHHTTPQNLLEQKLTSANSHTKNREWLVILRSTEYIGEI